MFDDVLKISHDTVTSDCLGVVAGDNAGNPLQLFIAVLVIKEKFLSFPIHDDTPLAVWGTNVELAIFLAAGNAILLAELIDCNLFFAKPGTNRGAAVTHPIAMFSGFFWGIEVLLVLLVHPLTDFAVGEVKYLLSAFYAVEYHLGSSPFSVWHYYTNRIVL